MLPIKLLGRSTLINQRTGGKFNSYQPSDQDAALFQKLRTSVHLLEARSLIAYHRASSQIQLGLPLKSAAEFPLLHRVNPVSQ
jgi:hypothetical protein